MSEINIDEFQKEGMVIESDRILIYSKMSCPLGCKYCFVDDLNGDRDGQDFYLSSGQLELLKTLPENINTIMLGCDTEFFQDEKEALRVLKNISVLNKDVSMITKLNLSDNLVEELKVISDDMRLRNNVLSFSVSLPCFESSKIWEPNAPDVQDRIDTLKKVSEAGIPSMAAIRPLIPNILTSEVDKIIELTKPYVFGYFSGPLYIKDLNNGIITEEDINNPDILITETEPDWMPKGNTFFKIENPKLMLYLEGKIKESGKAIFNGAAQGIDFIKDNKI